MNDLNRPRLLLVLGILIVSYGATAQANYVTETVTMSTGELTTDFTKGLSIPTFNTSQGTLENIVITYTDSATMQGYVKNTSAKAQTFTVAEDSNVKLNYGTTTLLTNDLIARQSYNQLGPLQTGIFGPYDPSGAPQQGYTISSGPLFEAFLAPSGSVLLTFSTLTKTTVTGGGGNITTGISTQAEATIAVEYIYQPFSTVPEPSSLALVVVGGLIAAGSRLRNLQARRRSAA